LSSSGRDQGLCVGIAPDLHVVLRSQETATGGAGFGFFLESISTRHDGSAATMEPSEVEACAIERNERWHGIAFKARTAAFGVFARAPAAAGNEDRPTHEQVFVCGGLKDSWVRVLATGDGGPAKSRPPSDVST
jgi:hypothetical protein